MATWVLMLHLHLVASDLVCSMHHGDIATAAPMLHHGPSHVAQRTDAGAHDAEPCSVPSSRDCCRSMASCSVNIGLGAAPSQPMPPIAGSIGPDVVIENPVSLLRAPDPPPPKS